MICAPSVDTLCEDCALPELVDCELCQSDCRALIRPSEAVAWSNLATVCIVLVRAEEALACSDMALTLRPDFPDALLARGDAFRSLMRPGEAVESYDKALALRPDSVEALNNRAVALRDLGRFEEALESCNKAIALAPSLATLHNSRAGEQDAGPAAAFQEFDWTRANVRSASRAVA